MFNLIGKLFKYSPTETREPYNEEKIKNLSTFEIQNELFQKTFKYSYEVLTPGQKVLHNLFILIGEVDNGGFIQYFQNNKEKYFKETLIAIKSIEDQKLLSLFEEGIEIYEHNEPFLSAKNLNENLDEEDEKRLTKLDGKFYEYESERKALINRYLQNNIKDFFINLIKN